MTDEVQTELRQSVLVIRLNRPRRLNAWTRTVRGHICDILDSAAKARDVRAIVFTGAGNRAFCAGQDLSEAEKVGSAGRTGEAMNELKRFYDAVRGMPKPVVGALNGLAAGSGFQVALLMDVIVAHPAVQMGQPEVNSGIPSILGPWLIKESLGRSRSVELAVTGRMMDAAECFRLGLIHHLVDQQDVLETALSLAQDLGEKPAEAFRITKEYLCRANSVEYERIWQLATEGQVEAFSGGEPQAVIREFFTTRDTRKVQD
ncbi:enoyl-CoA hydratase/isomerase family protein [Bradyrhizobium arachidis]|uniref:enoyl-CoA hydratase/isomerase family protein n=1 Tax=Bradyrhizobium arachidis TaxID=858423 RepID=UPI002161FABE|nr:enoyl-CoA hydratase/isomerase family protein [Bradyrhizobium arachidis]UVO35780.1 enoyl-CoA hydratase/isomerase family protein [Bradyrhizobium arachidis]